MRCLSSGSYLPGMSTIPRRAITMRRVTHLHNLTYHIDTSITIATETNYADHPAHAGSKSQHYLQLSAKVASIA